MTWILLAALLGMLFTYPAYFYLLYEFKMRLARDHPGLWQKRAASSASPGLQVAYKALREVREGKLDGVRLSAEVENSHRLATQLLYAGMLSFMVILFVVLYDSLWGAGR